VTHFLRWPGAAAFVAAAGLAYAGWYAAAARFQLEPEAAASCVQPVTDWTHARAVFGRFGSYDEAEQVQRLAEARGFQGTKVAVDPCGRVAIAVDGITSRSVAEDYRREAAGAGFEVTFEQAG
jgi:hypothetical protein